MSDKWSGLHESQTQLWLIMAALEPVRSFGLPGISYCSTTFKDGDLFA